MCVSFTPPIYLKLQENWSKIGQAARELDTVFCDIFFFYLVTVVGQIVKMAPMGVFEPFNQLQVLQHIPTRRKKFLPQMPSNW